MKVNVTLNDELVKRIDSYAEENYMSRSGLLSLAASQYLNGVEMTSSLRELSLCFRKISETNEIDEETRQKLDDFRKFVKYLPITF